MTLRILVIDDEASGDGTSKDRKAKYGGLADDSFGKGIEINFASSIDNAHALLDAEKFDAVILDVWLTDFKDDKQGTGFAGLFVKASTLTTVALVSENWDGTVVPRVSKLLAEHDEVPVPLMLSYEDVSAYATIILQLRESIRRRRKSLTLPIKAGYPLNILHLSDLHFGSSNCASTIAGVANVETMCANVLRAVDGNRIHLIALTGDIANTGHPAEYDEAEVWLKRVASALEIPLPSRRVFLVPGNHDFSLPLSLARCLSSSMRGKKLAFSLDSKKTNSAFAPLSEYASTPFIEFCRRISSADYWKTSRSVRSWVDNTFSDYGVLFSGLNSSVRVGETGWPRCWVDVDEVGQLRKCVEENAHLLHILLCHHSPVSTISVQQPIENRQEFDVHYLSDETLAPKIILHGHEHMRAGHKPSGEKMLVISSPTPSMRESSRPPDTLRGLNLISVAYENQEVHSVEAKSLVFDGSRWKQSKLEPEASLRVHLG